MRRAWGRLLSVDLGVAGLLLVTVAATKAGTLDVPYHWDEIGAYVTPAHWLAEAGLWRALPGLHPATMFFGHPPGLYLSLATVYAVAGDSIRLAHLLAVGFALLGAWFTYLVGRHLHDRLTGLLAALFLFFSPLYFAQSGMVLGDLPVAALGVASVHFALRRQWRGYLISAIGLVLVKESALAIVVAVLVYLYLAERGSPHFRRTLIVGSVPLLVAALFLAGQALITGAQVLNPYFQSHAFIQLSPDAVVMQARRALGWMYYTQLRVLLVALVLLALVVRGRRAWRREYGLFVLISLSFAGAFSIIFFLPRYTLPALPYLCLLAAGGLATLLPGVMARAAVGLLLVALLAGARNSPPDGYGNYEVNMRYVDVVRSHAAACAWVEERYPDKRVLAVWPLSQGLQYPWLGYVSRPITVVPAGEAHDVILYTPQGVRENEQLKALAQDGHMRLDRRFQRRHSYVEVYVSR